MKDFNEHVERRNLKVKGLGDDINHPEAIKRAAEIYKQGTYESGGHSYKVESPQDAITAATEQMREEAAKAKAQGRGQQGRVTPDSGDLGRGPQDRGGSPSGFQNVEYGNGNTAIVSDLVDRGVNKYVTSDLVHRDGHNKYDVQLLGGPVIPSVMGKGPNVLSAREYEARFSELGLMPEIGPNTIVYNGMTQAQMQEAYKHGYQGAGVVDTNTQAFAANLRKGGIEYAMSQLGVPAEQAQAAQEQFNRDRPGVNNAVYHAPVPEKSAEVIRA
jgi:hypothetical protein